MLGNRAASVGVVVHGLEHSPRGAGARQGEAVGWRPGGLTRGCHLIRYNSLAVLCRV